VYILSFTNSGILDTGRPCLLRSSFFTDKGSKKFGGGVTCFPFYLYSNVARCSCGVAGSNAALEAAVGSLGMQETFPPVGILKLPQTDVPCVHEPQSSVRNFVPESK
jgi:hypothetical protein